MVGTAPPNHHERVLARYLNDAQDMELSELTCVSSLSALSVVSVCATSSVFGRRGERLPFGVHRFSAKGSGETVTGIVDQTSGSHVKASSSSRSPPDHRPADSDHLFVSPVYGVFSPTELSGERHPFGAQLGFEGTAPGAEELAWLKRVFPLRLLPTLRTW